MTADEPLQTEDDALLAAAWELACGTGPLCHAALLTVLRQLFALRRTRRVLEQRGPEEAQVEHE